MQMFMWPLRANMTRQNNCGFSWFSNLSPNLCSAETRLRRFTESCNTYSRMCIVQLLSAWSRLPVLFITNPLQFRKLQEYCNSFCSSTSKSDWGFSIHVGVCVWAVHPLNECYCITCPVVKKTPHKTLTLITNRCKHVRLKCNTCFTVNWEWKI